MIKTTTSLENDIKRENKKILKENNILLTGEQQETQKESAENLLCPPKKKCKQDVIAFPKQSKVETTTEMINFLPSPLDLKSYSTPSKQKEIQFPKISSEEAFVLTAQQVSNLKKSNDQDSCNCSENDADILKSALLLQSKSPVSIEESTTPASSKKKSPVSKEERQKDKESKEQQKLQRQQELEEKKRKREEEKFIKQTEKEKRELERKEKERLREEEKKRKEEDKKKREEQKEIELKKKEAEKVRKEAEKKQKEEQKRAEEEKKRHEEAAQRKKQEKAANQFKSFFTKNSTVVKKEEKEEDQRFKSFQLKPNMILAPVSRSQLENKENFDLLLEQEFHGIPTYLEELAAKHANNKTPFLTRRKLRKEYEEKRKTELLKIQEEKKNNQVKQTCIETPTSSEVIVLNDSEGDEEEDDEEEDDEEEDDGSENSIDEKAFLKTKLLQFSENTRPAYYGTWRKRSRFVSGRRPFQMDVETFNYDIDSDEEWIDEPGEDCSDVGDDDEEEDKETEDDHDGFFVPHGYLSDDEGVKNSDEEDMEEDGNNKNDSKVSRPSSESREEDKLRAKVFSFEVEFQKKLKPKKPLCFGICYNFNDLPKLLQEYYKVELFKPQVEKVEQPDIECESRNLNDVKAPQVDQGNQVAMTVPEEAMEHLIRLLHGNTNSLRKIIDTFKQYWKSYVLKHQLNVRAFISKRQLERKIQTIATRSHNVELAKSCYAVNPEILEKYSMTELRLGEGCSSIHLNQDSTNCVVSMDLDSTDPVANQMVNTKEHFNFAVETEV